MVGVILLRLQVPANTLRWQGHFEFISSVLSLIIRVGDEISTHIDSEGANSVCFMKLERHLRKQCFYQNINLDKSMRWDKRISYQRIKRRKYIQWNGNKQKCWISLRLNIIMM